MSDRPFDSARARQDLDSHITGAPIEPRTARLLDNPRPIATQLERIEQAVTAALEGQARLNALVDGQRESFGIQLSAVEAAMKQIVDFQKALAQHVNELNLGVARAIGNAFINFEKKIRRQASKKPSHKARHAKTS